mmetsp:Transcript_23518/g.75305  ORF Transcript_23518/g.75305 Transcript_23518/m.75305 type:complete len:205 (-) Transcript_23518:143-757(-)
MGGRTTRDGVERGAKASLVGVSARLLRQASKVLEDTHRGVRRALLCGAEHQLEERQPRAQLLAQCVGMPRIQPRVAQHEHCERVDERPLAEPPNVGRGYQRGARHLLVSRHYAAVLGERDQIFNVDERRVSEKGVDCLAAEAGPTAAAILPPAGRPVRQWDAFQRLSEGLLRRCRRLGRRFLLRRQLDALVILRAVGGRRSRQR